MEDLFLVDPSRPVCEDDADDVDVRRASDAFEELRACLQHILLVSRLARLQQIT